MMASILPAALWILQYLERCKSARPFSLQVKKIVPASAPLYVYADTMNDFNYYTGRERMPILASPAAVGALIAKGENGFMLIKDRDLNGSRNPSAIGSLLRRVWQRALGT